MKTNTAKNIKLVTFRLLKYTKIIRCPFKKVFVKICWFSLKMGDCLKFKLSPFQTSSTILTYEIYVSDWQLQSGNFSAKRKKKVFVLPKKANRFWFGNKMEFLAIWINSVCYFDWYCLRNGIRSIVYLHTHITSTLCLSPCIFPTMVPFLEFFTQPFRPSSSE